MLYVLNSRKFAYSAILLIAKFSTVRMVIFACRRQANDALLHYPSSIAAADVLIKTRIEEIKYLSTKDRQNVECRQLMMVVSLAMIANNDPYSEVVKEKPMIAGNNHRRCISIGALKFLERTHARLRQQSTG